METMHFNFDPDSPENFFEQLARLKANSPVSYQHIKDALDPLNIFKAGEPVITNSVEYFVKAWNGDVREYYISMADFPLYDAQDWLRLLCGQEHGDFYHRQFSQFDGFYMGSLANDVYALCLGERNEKRWVGGVVGMRAIAIHLCSRRRRKGLDMTRISIHASRIASEAVLAGDMKYNERIREAVNEFCNGQRLELWESVINSIED